MIGLMMNLPDSVLGFTATGQITQADYESVVQPAVENALKNREKVRLLCHLSNVTGITRGALWDDIKLAVMHLRAWEKLALVTDNRWLRRGVNLLRKAVPDRVRVFSSDEMSQARSWIAA